MRFLLSFLFFFLLFTLISIPSPSLAIGYAVPVSKDSTTQLYYITVSMKTPLQRTYLHLDLGGRFTWLDCQKNYTSTSYKHLPCKSPVCLAFGHNYACSNCFKPPGPTCANNTCGTFPENFVIRKSYISIAIVDTLQLSTSDGTTLGKPRAINNFVFSCAPSFLCKGLAKKTPGVVALGTDNFSLPLQVSRAFHAPKYFALCLPSSTSSPGVAFLGSSGPYRFLPQETDLSKFLLYTPLLPNPMSDSLVYSVLPSPEYFIGLTSIKVNDKPVPINVTLLTINQDGIGGTKLSTNTPYTLLESSIYKALTDAFVKEFRAPNLTVTKAVKTFGFCYSTDQIPVTRVGPAVPNIDLVMQSESVFWRIFGANSMVWYSKGEVNAWCLGFLDGGVGMRASVVIGGHQMEDNLLQFDLVSKRLGFSSSLLFGSTTCSNFNFTTTK
ncbi:hypothetical protein SLA2020_483130 [Shorea laevis]